LAECFGLSLPIIQHMEASGGVIRGKLDSPMKLANALSASGIALIGNNAPGIAGSRATLFIS
jgi:hypothetical protein